MVDRGGHRGSHRPPYRAALGLGLIAVSEWHVLEPRLYQFGLDSPRFLSLPVRAALNLVHYMATEGMDADARAAFDASLMPPPPKSPEERLAERVEAIAAAGGEVTA